MQILLIHPPDEMEAMLGVGREFVQKYEPLGLLYIAAVILGKGLDVVVIDAHADSVDCEEIKRRISVLRPDIVGLSVLTCSGGLVYELGQWIKRNHPDILVVFGNVHASVYAGQYLRHGCCDIVVHGEGEHPFLKIIDYRRGECALGEIPGISYRDQDHRVVNTFPGTFLVEDLSSLPMPARGLVDRKLYQLDTISNQLYVGKARSSSKTMSTSRGCWYKCTFCVVNQRPRFNAPRRVVDELEYLEKGYDADYTLIVDPLCMYDKERMFRICDEIGKRRLRIKWGCDARVSCITPELIRAMDRAHCYDLSFGIESGVQRLLNNVKKGTTIPQIKDAINCVKQNSDIRVGGLFILGLPGETYSDSLETISFAKSLPLDMAQFSLCTPYPGSALFDKLSSTRQLDTGLRPDGSLDTTVWKRYSAYISFTANQPIWVTPEQTPDQLRELQKRAQREFYMRPSQILKHVTRIKLNNIFRVAKILRQVFF